MLFRFIQIWIRSVRARRKREHIANPLEIAYAVESTLLQIDPERHFLIKPAILDAATPAVPQLGRYSDLSDGCSLTYAPKLRVSALGLSFQVADVA